MDAPPEVPPIRHVAVLTLRSARCRWARLPFFVRVLQKLAVESEAVVLELMAARAEFGGHEGRGPRGAAMRQARLRRRRMHRPLAARRAEALVLPDMAGGTDDSLAVQGGVEDRAILGLLLGQRRVARQAEARRFRIGTPQLRKLSGHTRPHALRVMRRPPVRELGGMAGAAALRGQRRLERSEASEWDTLRRDRSPPVAAQEFLDGDPLERGGRPIAGSGKTPEQDEDDRDRQRRSHPRKHARTQQSTLSLYSRRAHCHRGFEVAVWE